MSEPTKEQVERLRKLANEFIDDHGRIPGGDYELLADGAAIHAVCDAYKERGRQLMLANQALAEMRERDQRRVAEIKRLQAELGEAHAMFHVGEPCEAEARLAEIEAGCDIQKSHGLYRQVRVVIGPGKTQAEIDRDDLGTRLREVVEKVKAGRDELDGFIPDDPDEGWQPAEWVLKTLDEALAAAQPEEAR